MFLKIHEDETLQRTILLPKITVNKNVYVNEIVVSGGNCSVLPILWGDLVSFMAVSWTIDSLHVWYYTTRKYIYLSSC